jgi:aminoglycoside phosphotransferase (APT) family kinase protein
LVHGDFSPKNVLCGPGGLWVIDFEVAHRGDPAFDLAFLLCHLTLKSLHLPAMSAELDACTEAFVAAYRSATDDLFITDWSYVFGHLGCLLLARVRGKSPAEYLGPAQQDMAWRLGRDLVQAPPPTLQDVHRRRDQARS